MTLIERLLASSDPLRYEAAQRIEALEFEIDFLSTDKAMVALKAENARLKEAEGVYLVSLQQAEAALDLAIKKENL